MARTNQLFHSSLVLLAATGLFAGSQPALAQDQPRQERRVLILRSDGEHLVEVEADTTRRGYIGIMMLDLTPELRRHFGVPSDRGIMISRVVGESPAERAGLQPGDILTSVDGRPISAGVHLSMSVAKGAKGDAIELETWRDGRSFSVEAEVAVHERSQLDISPLIQRRIHIDSPGSLEFRAGPHPAVEVEGEWIEKVVGNVGDRFNESTFLEQLEAMRSERADLHEQLRLMEERLQELESELRRLGSADG